MITMTTGRWLLAALAAVAIPIGLALRRIGKVALELVRYAGYIAITTFAVLYVVELIIIIMRTHR